MQPQVEDRLRLNGREVIPALVQAELGREFIGARIHFAGTLQHARDRARLPGFRNQRFPRLCGRRRALDQFDHFVDVGEGNRLPFQHVSTVPRLAQIEYCPPRDDFAPVREKRLENLLQVHQLRSAVVQRHHVDAEDRLHGGLLVEIVQDDVR